MLADFHNHSCLSPCASLDMSPMRLASEAAAKGIGLFGLADHNSARNAPAFAEACRRTGLAALFGLEIATEEECHVLALFDNVPAALAMDAWVTGALPRIPLDAERFGDQPVVDADGTILEMLDWLLIVAVTRSIEAVREQTRCLGGLFIPCHLDRPLFSIESQLGFLPDEDYDAIEVLPGSEPVYRQRYPGLPVITSSDAHQVEDIGRGSFRFEPQGVDISSVRQALAALVSR